MENAGYIALSRQVVLERQIEVIANNMANASTPAYKAESMQFNEYLIQADEGAPLSFVEDAGVMRDWTAGTLRPTGNPLDLAINGEGYFVVSTPDGDRYTRNGRFALDAAGQIVTGDGNPVRSDGGPIIVPTEDVKLVVAADGTVSTEIGIIGRIRIVRFADPQALAAVGAGLYQTDAAPEPDSASKISQGMVEDSNVQPIIEMTNLIQVTRDYQAAQKMIEAEHERQRRAIANLVGTAA
jgi:flagellar basal-body rod protein FlgF